MSRTTTARAAVVVLLASAFLASCASGGPHAREIEISGDPIVHDPALVVTDDAWYVYSTGDSGVGAGSPHIRRSTDEGVTWEDLGTVWDAETKPTWIDEQVRGVQNIWAPEVTEHDGTYYLYYSASRFGRNTSAIGLTTSPTLDPDDPDYGWTDQGLVWASSPSETPYNAIDPGLISDEQGNGWMAFGSFWGGIQLLPIEWPSGKPPADAQPEVIAIRDRAVNPIEAPYLVHRDGWYYLFVSRDFCCQGVDSTYQIAVGRSEQVTGPYLDRSGVAMTEGGGEVLLTTQGDRIGPGGQSFSEGYLAFHYYDGPAAGIPQLAIRELAWDGDGWPVATVAGETLP